MPPIQCSLTSQQTRHRNKDVLVRRPFATVSSAPYERAECVKFEFDIGHVWPDQSTKKEAIVRFSSPERSSLDDVVYLDQRKLDKFETFTLADCHNSRVRLGGACASLNPHGDIRKCHRAYVLVAE
jgi:hypothetical protein